MTEDTTACAAQDRGCGTPSGWRNGGRCVRCRRAHNEESRASRAMTPEQRTQVLDLIRAGKTVEEAASRVGRTARSLQAAAVCDSELRSALDGEPLVRQEIARRGDLLLAMIRNGGNRAQAARDIGEKLTTVDWWKRGDPLFSAVEEAVIAWVSHAEPNRRRKVSDAQLDHAADLMDSGIGPVKAAEAVGLVYNTLWNYRARHERLNAAWRHAERRGTKPSGLGPEKSALLRSLWADQTVTVGEIGHRLGVSAGTVASWRKKLGLPPRSNAPGTPRATGESTS